jgi:hypothetical protein
MYQTTYPACSVLEAARHAHEKGLNQPAPVSLRAWSPVVGLHSRTCENQAAARLRVIPHMAMTWDRASGPSSGLIGWLCDDRFHPNKLVGFRFAVFIIDSISDSSPGQVVQDKKILES